MVIDERGPFHIGIIMDGNRRWAKSRGMNAPQGHLEGAKTLKKIVGYSYDIGLKYLTLYAFSTENWKRSKIEVTAIMKILYDYTNDLLNGEDKRDIKFKVYGDITKLDDNIQKNILELEERTKNNKKMVLGICINYGGRDELIRATKSIVSDVANGKISKEDIDDKMISSKLYTCDIPDPDLIIRTSGEYRLSNFLTWQSAYSELYFPSVMWPDFDEKEMDKAIEEYLKRNRRFGGN